jgi:hypothetical protein
VMAAMRRQNTFPLRKVRTGPGAAAAALAAVPGRLGKSRSADQPVDLQLPPAVPPGRTRGMDGISSCHRLIAIKILSDSVMDFDAV